MGITRSEQELVARTKGAETIPNAKATKQNGLAANEHNVHAFLNRFLGLKMPLYLGRTVIECRRRSGIRQYHRRNLLPAETCLEEVKVVETKCENELPLHF